MMTLKPKDSFKLKQSEEDSIFKGLELIVANDGPNTIEVSAEGNKITIEVKSQPKETYH